MSQLDRVITNEVSQSHNIMKQSHRGFKFENLKLILINSY